MKTPRGNAIVAILLLPLSSIVDAAALPRPPPKKTLSSPSKSQETGSTPTKSTSSPSKSSNTTSSARSRGTASSPPTHPSHEALELIIRDPFRANFERRKAQLIPAFQPDPDNTPLERATAYREYRDLKDANKIMRRGLLGKNQQLPKGRPDPLDQERHERQQNPKKKDYPPDRRLADTLLRAKMRYHIGVNDRLADEARVARGEKPMRGDRAHARIEMENRDNIHSHKRELDGHLAKIASIHDPVKKARASKGLMDPNDVQLTAVGHRLAKKGMTSAEVDPKMRFSGIHRRTMPEQYDPFIEKAHGKDKEFLKNVKTHQEGIQVQNKEIEEQRERHRLQHEKQLEVARQQAALPAALESGLQRALQKQQQQQQQQQRSQQHQARRWTHSGPRLGGSGGIPLPLPGPVRGMIPIAGPPLGDVAGRNPPSTTLRTSSPISNHPQMHDPPLQERRNPNPRRGGMGLMGRQNLQHAINPATHDPSPVVPQPGAVTSHPVTMRRPDGALPATSQPLDLTSDAAFRKRWEQRISARKQADNIIAGKQTAYKSEVGGSPGKRSKKRGRNEDEGEWQVHPSDYRRLFGDRQPEEGPSGFPRRSQSSDSEKSY